MGKANANQEAKSQFGVIMSPPENTNTLPGHHEADLTACIRHHVLKFVEWSEGDVSVDAYQPGNQQQSSENFDKACYDIILRVSKGHVLLLEVKYLKNGERRFSSFPNVQREALNDLERMGLPIFICYNIAEDYSRAPGHFYSVNCCLTSTPTQICDESGDVLKGNHLPLRNRIKSSLLDAAKSDATSVPVFNDALLPELSTRLLLFSYNPKLKKLSIFSGPQMARAIKIMARDQNREGMRPSPQPDPRNDGPGMSM